MAALKQSLASMEGRKKPAGRVESAQEADQVQITGEKTTRAKNPHGKSTRKKKAA
jgi:hypothetical protein